MSSRELSPEWVLSSFIPPNAAPQHEISELIVVARRLWPRVQAHAYREQPGKSSDEAIAFASEVWEGVLRSVAKTIQRYNGRNWRIKNMEAYLFGAFHHRPDYVRQALKLLGEGAVPRELLIDRELSLEDVVPFFAAHSTTSVLKAAVIP